MGGNMNRGLVAAAWISLIASLFLFIAQAQQPPMLSGSTALPHFVRFNGTAKDPSGHPLTGTVGITFSLYSDQADGSPRWLETQNVQLDNSGHYGVLLGSTKSEGLPVASFASEQAHWVGVEISGQSEGPRVLLVSAPYALKAGDAETVGGLPPSAFMLAAPSAPKSGKTGEVSPVITIIAIISGSGTAGFLPQWTSSTILGSSALFQTGSGGASMIGINTATPSASLDVNGSLISRGALQLPSTGTASASQGFTVHNRFPYRDRHSTAAQGRP
jgi:hypothetical protein